MQLPTIMDAITLHRPWPSAIFDLPPGVAKNIENRSWPPPGDIIGTRIAIHAGIEWDQAGAELIEELTGQRFYSFNCPRGVVGTVIVRRVIHPRTGETDIRWWNPEYYGWFLAQPIRFDHPRPATGKQGVWTWRPHQKTRDPQLTLL
ncbi:MAG: hypothetical protein K0U84_14080 [Actinomycetia bacterium]|nr:hypothetical protein [Actinomycetes bacterium]